MTAMTLPSDRLEGWELRLASKDGPAREWPSGSTQPGTQEVFSSVESTARSQVVPEQHFLPPTALASGSSRSPVPPEQRRLAVRARDAQWSISRGDLTLDQELSHTLHSTLYLSSWKGMTVVVKCAGPPEKRSSTWAGQAGPSPDQTSENKAATDSMVQELLHEIEMMSCLRHPDVLMFLGAALDSGSPVMCVTEYMPHGDLERYYQRQRRRRDSCAWRPPLVDVVEWCLALARGLHFLHSRDAPVVHRDLKPMNLFLTSTLQLKLGDLGSCTRLESGGCLRTKGVVGTWRYMAPEVVRREEYNEKVDIYAFGLVMYFMSSGRMPFHQYGLDPKAILDDHFRGLRPRPRIGDCYPALRPLMVAAWHEVYQRRPSAQELLGLLSNGQSQKAPGCGCALM
mmetsp:Transcript_65725/g.154667  ORF Transcript_65725/g.154667 Transcript_65725/m.154667 type:complete len:398 (+) Transcript_65725:1-1194(+)